MKEMMKKLVLMMLVVLMAAGLVACGCGTANEGGGSAENTAPETTAVEETTEETMPAETEAVTEAETENATTNEEAGNVTGETVGNMLLLDFRNRIAQNSELTAQEMADAILSNPIIQFAGATMPVEEGLLTGFNNAEITGFKEGVMFAPTIGSIPFVGYIFTLEEGADVDAFMQLLKDNADPRWNICTEAEETLVENAENMVFFVMSPTQFE